MEVKFNFESLKKKFKSLKKRELVIAGFIVFTLMVFYLKFFKIEDNFQTLMKLEPNRNFVIDDIMEEEKAKVESAIKKEEGRNKGVGRDVFFSYIDSEGRAPTLTGVMIGRKRLATFSNGLILEVGDDFYGYQIKKILQGEIILEDSLGDEKILKIRRD